MKNEMMKKASKEFPSGIGTLSPYLFVHEADRLIDFLKGTFDAQEASRSLRDDEKVSNAQVIVGDSLMMLSEATAEFPAMHSSFYLYVADTDATYDRALELGGTSVMEPRDTPYGDRNAGVKDPSGNIWWIATRLN